MQKHTRTQTRTHTHRDSNEYSIVEFSKNASIIIENLSTILKVLKEQIPFCLIYI